MQNIELKVRVPDLAQVRSRAIALGAEHHWTRKQTDTYFRVATGRLKLRETDGDDPATLIAYARPDDPNSRISQYELLPVSDGERLKRMLVSTLGVLVTVRKTRELYLAGDTRIHLDQVDMLGSFVELETVVSEQSMADAMQEHHKVKSALRLDTYEPVAISYSDLIMNQ